MSELKKYFLEMKLNDHVVSLKLDSGCDKPLISKSLWSEIGEPALMDIGDTRRSATGVLPLKGGFLARMHFAGIDFECPVQVSDDDGTRNLIGRRAFPFLLDFDWNQFISDGTVTMVSDLTPDNINKEKLMNDALKWKSKQFHVNVLVNHKNFRMILDTGATCSIAGLNKWEDLGVCSLNIIYNGATAQLPLLIADNDKIPAILGIQFAKPLEQPAAVPRWTKIVYDIDDDGGSQPAKHLATRPKPENVKVRKCSAHSPLPPVKRVKITFDLEVSVKPPVRQTKKIARSIQWTNEIC